MKVKCTKRYSDICLKEIVEEGTVLEVTEERGAHLISEGVAELVKEPAKAAAKGKEQVIHRSPIETQGEASFFTPFPPGVKEADSIN